MRHSTPGDSLMRESRRLSTTCVWLLPMTPSWAAMPSAYWQLATCLVIASNMPNLLAPFNVWQKENGSSLWLCSWTNVPTFRQISSYITTASSLQTITKHMRNRRKLSAATSLNFIRNLYFRCGRPSHCKVEKPPLTEEQIKSQEAEIMGLV